MGLLPLDHDEEKQSLGQRTPKPNLKATVILPKRRSTGLVGWLKTVMYGDVPTPEERGLDRQEAVEVLIDNALRIMVRTSGSSLQLVTDYHKKLSEFVAVHSDNEDFQKWVKAQALSSLNLATSTRADLLEVLRDELIRVATDESRRHYR
jgi:hypothetical protein